MVFVRRYAEMSHQYNTVICHYVINPANIIADVVYSACEDIMGKGPIKLIVNMACHVFVRWLM